MSDEQQKPKLNTDKEAKPDSKDDAMSKTIMDADEAKSAGNKVQTAMLTDFGDLDVQPMIDRDPEADAITLDDRWRVQFKIGDQKKTLPLTAKIIIGRAVDTDMKAGEINFDLTPFGAYHFGVSRHHAIMSLSNGYLFLEDLGSTNGTRINGFQLTANQKYRLRNGDEVEFARLRGNIVFKAPDA